jgi:predicted permease
MRSFARLSEVSPGFDPSGTLVASISLPDTAYPDDTSHERVVDQFLARVRALPRVEAAGITQSVPLLGDHVASLDFEGRPAASPTERPTTNFYAITPGFFEAMKIPLIRGRAITDADRQGTQRVVVINQRLAERDFSGEDPIGRRIRVSQGNDDWRTIIGIVGDTKQYGVMERTPAQVYEPYRQHRYFSSVSAIVRVKDGNPASLAPELRSVMRSIDPQLPLARVRSMQDVLSESVGPQRFSAVLIALFGAAALLLASIGLYGVMAYLVGQRTQEFAIRIAHGATRTAILRLVLVNGAATVLIGTAIGIAGALLLRRLLAGLLFGISATDPVTYAAVAVVLVGVALAASVVPALRATRVDPIVALRAE